jgi:hypothetical protein
LIRPQQLWMMTKRWMKDAHAHSSTVLLLWHNCISHQPCNLYSLTASSLKIKVNYFICNNKKR